MILFFSILAIVVVNLCLGYAAAAFLGYAPPSLRTAWDTLFSREPVVGTEDNDAGPSP